MLDTPAMPESMKAKVRTLLRQAQEHEQQNRRMSELRCSFCGEGFDNPVVRSLFDRIQTKLNTRWQEYALSGL